MKRFSPLVLLLILFSGLAKAQRIAYYPLMNVFPAAGDMTGNYGELEAVTEASGTPAQIDPTWGLCLNGVWVYASGGQSWATPSITALNIGDFRIDIDVKLNSLNTAQTFGCQVWAVGRGCFAPVALRIKSDGKIAAVYNGNMAGTFSGFTMPTGQIQTLSLRHIGNSLYLYVNGTYIDDVGIDPLTNSCSNQIITQIDTLLGQGMNGCIKELSIYNHAVVIVPPSNMTITAPNHCGATVNFPNPQVYSNSSAPVTFIPASGSFFNIGTHAIKVVTSNGFTTDTAKFTLTVNQGPPSFTCPPDLTRNADAGACTLTGLTLFSPSPTICSGGVPTFSNNAPSVYPLGTTNVIWTASLNGQTNTCTQHITVVDATPPVLNSCPGNITVYDADNCGQAVTYSPPTATDCNGPTTITRTAGLASGSVFPVGTTTVTYQAKDAANNISTCNFTVTVIDTIPPVLSCPGNISADAPAGQSSAVVSYTPPGMAAGCCVLQNAIAGFTALGFYNGHSYYMSSSTADWETARATAQAAGGRLVMITSAGEQAFLNAALAPFAFLNYTFWLGGRQNHSSGSYAEPAGGWEWIDGTAFSYTNWNGGEPNNSSGNEDHLQMTAGGGWNDNNSTSTHRILLEMDCLYEPVRTAGLASGSSFPIGDNVVTYSAMDPSGNTGTCSFTVTVADTTHVVMHCPGDTVLTATQNEGIVVNYTVPTAADPYCTPPVSLPTAVYLGSFNGHTYFKTLVPGSWASMKSVAENAGGSLVAINSAAENSFISSLPGIGTCWTGGYQDLADPSYAEPGGGWKWTDGTAFSYTNWNAGEPNNAGAGEHNIEISSGGVWNDNSGSVSHAGLLEFGCDVTPVLVSGLPSGSVFPIGTTTVTYQAANYLGTITTCSFTVTVHDGVPPVINCTSDTVVYVDGSLPAINYTIPTVDAADCVLPVSKPGLTYLGSFNNHTYFRTNTQMSWPNAKNAALAAGGHLVSISSAAEQTFVTSLLGGQSHWNGLFQNHANPSYAEPGGGYEWEDGTPVTYTNWNPGEPNGTTDDFVEMNSAGKWGDIGGGPRYGLLEFGCGTDLVRTSGPASGSVFPYGPTTVTYTATDSVGNAASCSFTITVADTTAPVVACSGDTTIATGASRPVVNYPAPVISDGGCIIPTSLANFTYLGTYKGHTYFHSNNAMSWTTAKTTVEAAGGELAVISSAAEQTFINSVLDGNSYWTGGFQNTASPSYAENGGGWEWIDGTPFNFTNWGGGEPNGGTNENYIGMTSSGQWQDAAQVSPRLALAEFSCGMDLELVSGLPSGSAFPPGVTQIMYTATDAAGNAASCSFSVNVVDTTAPSVTCIGDTSIQLAAGMQFATVSYAFPTVTDGDCVPPTSVPGLVYLGKFESHTYFRTSTQMIWPVANSTAIAAGGKLLTINNAAEQSALNGMLGSNSYWIGAFQNMASPDYAENAGGWEWADGTPMTYTNWNSGEPNGGTSENFISINGAGTWVDNSPAGARYGLIEFGCDLSISRTSGLASGAHFPAGPTTITYKAEDAAGNADSCSFVINIIDTAALSIACQPDTVINIGAGQNSAVVNYAAPIVAKGSCVAPTTVANMTYLGTLNGHTYFRTNTPLSWTAAKNTATAAGGKLAVVTTSAEQTFLKNMTGTDSYWLGGFQNTSSPEYSENGGGWEWVDGAPFAYTNWGGSDPNGGTTENFLLMNAGTGLWADFPGGQPKLAFVEFDCGYELSRTAGPASGSSFPAGSTTVAHTVTDYSGHSVSCSFSVTVNHLPVFLNSAPQAMTVCQPGGSVDIKPMLHVNDPDAGQNLLWTEATAPAHGTIITGNAGASSGGTDLIPVVPILYIPAAGYAGSDAFTIRVSDGVSFSDLSITVVVRKALLTIVSGANMVCKGDTIVLQAPAGSGYRWWKDGHKTNQTSREIHIWQSGSFAYAATYIDALCGSLATDTQTVVVNNLPIRPKLTKRPHVCLGDTLSISGPSGYADYKWKLNGDLTAETGSVIVVDTNGDYTLTVTDDNGCTSPESAVKKIRFKIPPTATIKMQKLMSNGAIRLMATSGAFFQWYFNGSELPGETLKYLLATQSGNYRLRVTSQAGCDDISPDTTLIVNYTGARLTPEEEALPDGGDDGGDESTLSAQPTAITIAPNPSTGIFHIYGTTPLRAIVRDMQGKTIDDIENATAIDLSGRANGIYMLQLYDDEGTLVKSQRISKQ